MRASGRAPWWWVRFGLRHERRGSAALLRERGQALGFGVDIVGPVEAGDGIAYSSTHIREHLTAGRPRQAAALLGRFWEIDGRVERGDQRGRTIGFPTANIFLQDYLRPAAGVYAVRAGIEEGSVTLWRDAVANFGRRPPSAAATSGSRSISSTMPASSTGGISAWRSIDFLRPEQKFAGIDALKAQIAADAAQARTILAAVPAF